MSGSLHACSEVDQGDQVAPNSQLFNCLNMHRLTDLRKLRMFCLVKGELS